MGCNGVKMVEMGLVEARGCLQSLGWNQHFRGQVLVQHLHTSPPSSSPRLSPWQCQLCSGCHLL